MGRCIVRCYFCGTYVMEGRNDWECDKCKAVCNSLTKFAWKTKEEYKNIKKDNKCRP